MTTKFERVRKGDRLWDFALGDVIVEEVSFSRVWLTNTMKVLKRSSETAYIFCQEGHLIKNGQRAEFQTLFWKPIVYKAPKMPKRVVKKEFWTRLYRGGSDEYHIEGYYKDETSASDDRYSDAIDIVKIEFQEEE